MNKQTIQLMINKLHSLGYATLDRSTREFARFEDKATYLVFNNQDCGFQELIDTLEDAGYTVSESGDTLESLTANLSTQEVLDKLNLDVEQVLLWALSHPDPMPVVSEPDPLVVYGVEYKERGFYAEFEVFKTLEEAEQFADEFRMGCMTEKQLADMKAQGLDSREYCHDRDIATAFINEHKL